MRGGGERDASLHATGANSTPITARRAEGETASPDLWAKALHTVKQLQDRVGQGGFHEDVVAAGLLGELLPILQQLQQKGESPFQDIIENAIQKAIQASQAAQQPPAPSPPITYANVASRGSTPNTIWTGPSAGSTSLSQNARERNTIKVRYENEEVAKKPAQELLQEVRKTFPQATSVCCLSSGDVQVRIKSKTEREKALQAKDKIPGLKVLRQDYLIEAVSVPLAEVQVEEGRNADNSALAQRITKETQ